MFKSKVIRIADAAGNEMASSCPDSAVSGIMSWLRFA